MLINVYVSLLAHNMMTQLKERWHMPGTVAFAKIIREADKIRMLDIPQFEGVCRLSHSGPAGKTIGLVDPYALKLLYHAHTYARPRKFMRRTAERMIIRAWLVQFPERALPPADRYLPKKVKAK